MLEPRKRGRKPAAKASLNGQPSARQQKGEGLEARGIERRIGQGIDKGTDQGIDQGVNQPSLGASEGKVRDIGGLEALQQTSDARDAAAIPVRAAAKGGSVSSSVSAPAAATARGAAPHWQPFYDAIRRSVESMRSE